jgi:spermidine/putrescine transport system permease protein
MQDTRFKLFSTTLVWVWLGIFVLIPSFLLVATSLLAQGDSELVRLQPTFDNYLRLFDLNYLRVFLRSGVLAGTCTVGCLLLGYPFSYLLARMPNQYKGILLLLVIIPFWTSSLIRSYSIVAILKTHGILNSFLMWLGIIQAPLQLLYTHTATLIGLIYTLLPLMILPLYASIEKLDFRLIDAARDLGAKKYQVFFRVLLPLTLPGILAGCILVLLPAMTLFYIPDLLGGAKTILIGNIIQNQFLGARDWPMGATVSIALTVLMGIVLFIYRYYYHSQQEFIHE